MEWILQAASIALGVGIIGKYVLKLRNLIKEAAEVFVVLDKMLADNNITLAEVVELKNESIDVWTAIKAFGKK